LVKSAPVLYLIAGSNGAGKTTFATEYFPQFVGQVDFINADLIARGLSPFDPDKVAASAGRLVLQRIRQLGLEGKTFAIETTLAGLGYARLIKRMRAAGYEVHLYFLWIPGPALAMRRIRARVRQGGHGVRQLVVKRRYGRSLRNLFRIYFDLADYVLIMDNSSDKPRPVATKRAGSFKVLDAKLMKRIGEQG